MSSFNDSFQDDFEPDELDDFLHLDEESGGHDSPHSPAGVGRPVPTQSQNAW